MLSVKVVLEKLNMENNEKEGKIQQLLGKVFDDIREKENSPGGYHHISQLLTYHANDTEVQRLVATISRYNRK